MIRILILASCLVLVSANYGSAYAGGGDSTQTRQQDNTGQYQYSFDINSPQFSQHQWEKSTAYNEREGAYSFQDAYGKIRIVKYVADKHGFRPVIQSNEPGLAHSPPAHIVFANVQSSNPPPYAPVSYSIAPAVSVPASKVENVHVYQSPTPPAPVVIKSSKSADPLYLQYSAPISTSVILSAPLQPHSLPPPPPPSPPKPSVIPSNYQVITGKPVHSSPVSTPHYPHQQPTVLLLPTVSSYKPRGKIVPKLVHPVQLIKIVSQAPKPTIKTPRRISYVKPIELITFAKPIKSIGTSYQYRWQQTAAKRRPIRPVHPIYASATPMLSDAYELLPPHSLAYH